MKLASLVSLPILIIAVSTTFAQTNVQRDIKSFGAKGDGKTNDHEAFTKAAAYFNARGGNGTLVISKGIYIIGKQTFTGGKPGKPAYEGENVLHFRKVKNFKISGGANAVLKYKDSLRFGAFNPSTGMPYQSGNGFFINSYAAVIGTCILFDTCSNIILSGITIDGNSKGIILGGAWGDVGRQLIHYGFFIASSSQVSIDKCQANNMGLDGINICARTSEKKENITISNSSFQFNARQGLSYTGGNTLYVKNCQFSNNGKGVFSSPPAAGVDIEGECGAVRNGVFTNCAFVNNAGVGLLAGTGEDSNFTFTNCTFWGITNWSIWVSKPAFTFNRCNIFGSIVWGYDSPDQANATKYINCTFEDKPYKGKEPYGNFIIESNGARRVSYTGCKFIANKKKLCWIAIDSRSTAQEKYQFTNCSFLIKGADYPANSYVGVMRGMVLKNCTFNFSNPNAKNKQYFFEGYTRGNNTNVDLGGNKILFSGQN